MRKSVPVLVLAAVCILGYVAKARAQVMLPAVPRTVTVSENGFVTTYATRSDGSYAMARQIQKPDGIHPYLEIHFIRDRKVVGVRGDLKEIQTSSFPPDSPTGSGLNLRNPATGCKQPYAGRIMGDVEMVGEETLLGYRVIHLRYRRDGRDQWFAPDLGCEELKAELHTTIPNNVRPLNVHRIATSITLGEPNPALFTIPTGYKQIN